MGLDPAKQVTEQIVLFGAVRAPPAIGETLAGCIPGDETRRTAILLKLPPHQE
jgi:hypothetical protein